MAWYIRPTFYYPYSRRLNVVGLPLTAGVRYLDNSVGTSGNGLTWATAWKQTTDIVWSQLANGGTLYISGGTTSKTYSGSLVPTTGGTSDSVRLTVRRGIDPGHDGEPIIDSAAAVSASINAANVDWTTFYGLRATDGFDAAFRCVSRNGITFDTCRALGGLQRCWEVKTSTNLIVRNCTGTNGVTTGQPDCLYSQLNEGYVYENNFFQSFNTDNTGHTDAFQSTNDGNGTVRNNTFRSSPAGGDNHAVWIYAINTGTTMNFYNNVCICESSTFNTTYWRDTGAAQNGTLNFYNNTIVGGSRTLNFGLVGNVVLRNNIAWPDVGGLAIFVELTALTTSNVTFNLLWAPSGTIANSMGVVRTWAQWQSDGYDANGVNLDPLFVDKAGFNYQLGSKSPAVNAGTTIGIVTTDNVGVVRPVGSAYEIGAFERLVSLVYPRPFLNWALSY